ncbi:uncharacterized protein TNIN_392891 [Trichonephila inaurata madagascariensis]|uniref:Reverse transcriptase domain-containing protein n=1 Tax=Trichonephila inaurata madagascariensis TaxID=2747483 RepID=A0A8X6Y2E2_9ARAC|nr:uncharacterized protein TNIN_392891 [Trichonephila inaurata madagascariensis]
MTRFRKHKYAFTTDIQMMFRQILIDPAQRYLLRVMWKTRANEEPVIYRLKTVTYGTTSDPFLAIQTLKQLAMDEASRFPLASKVALQDVYMDDVVSGAQNLDTAHQLQCQLQNMLETCGMKLHKWNSNSKELLNSSTDQEHSFSTNAESAIKSFLKCYFKLGRDVGAAIAARFHVAVLENMVKVVAVVILPDYQSIRERVQFYLHVETTPDLK